MVAIESPEYLPYCRERDAAIGHVCQELPGTKSRGGEEGQ